MNLFIGSDLCVCKEGGSLIINGRGFKVRTVGDLAANL